jgi:predicted ester cyclase
MNGTHRGKFFGFEPTGNRVEWPLAVFSRLVDGKVTEDWLVAATAQLEVQLGNTPR